MKKETYLIKNNDSPKGSYLGKIIIMQERELECFTWICDWHLRENNAIHLTSEEEAQATIEFIINVIDAEKEGYLEIVKARE